MFLKSFQKNTDIRIGAATNWFYFGSSSDEEKMNFTFRKRISEAQLNYKKLVDDIKSKEKVLKNLYQQKERAEAYINNYTSPLDRKIDDAYECKGNFYFVVNGSEVGKYWTKEEFEGDAKNERS